MAQGKGCRNDRRVTAAVRRGAAHSQLRRPSLSLRGLPAQATGGLRRGLPSTASIGKTDAPSDRSSVPPAGSNRCRALNRVATPAKACTNGRSGRPRKRINGFIHSRPEGTPRSGVPSVHCAQAYGFSGPERRGGAFRNNLPLSDAPLPADLAAEQIDRGEQHHSLNCSERRPKCSKFRIPSGVSTIHPDSSATIPDDGASCTRPASSSRVIIP